VEMFLGAHRSRKGGKSGEGLISHSSIHVHHQFVEHRGTQARSRSVSKSVSSLAISNERVTWKKGAH
jgi:hypothetical protein